VGKVIFLAEGVHGLTATHKLLMLLLSRSYSKLFDRLILFQESLEIIIVLFRIFGYLRLIISLSQPLILSFFG